MKVEYPADFGPLTGNHCLGDERGEKTSEQKCIRAAFNIVRYLELQI